MKWISHACMLSCFGRVQLFASQWAIVHQVPLSMGFSRQEYWSGLLCPPPGDLPDPGIEPVSLLSPVLAGECFTTSANWEAGNSLVYTYILSLLDLLPTPGSHLTLPPHPSPLGHHRALSWAPCAVQHLPTSYLFNMWQSPPVNAGDVGSIPGSGRSPGGGNGNPHQYSCLENPMDRGAWRATVHGVAEESDRT